MRFEDLDSNAAQLLADFRSELLNVFGCLTAAWRKGLDPKGQGRVDEESFLAACEAQGVTLGGNTKKLRKVFRLLLARHGQRSLTSEDLRALLIGIPIPDQWAVCSGSGGEYLPIAPPVQSSEPDALGTEGSGVMTGSMKVGPFSPKAMAPAPSPRHTIANVNLLHSSQDKVIASLPSFKRKLVDKFGSVFSAWRQCLDLDRNGKVTQRDFASACQLLGVKAVQRLWAELDAESRGQVSLRDLDPETADAFEHLDKALITQYGSTKVGWKKAFDTDGLVNLSLASWKKSFEKLGLEGDAERVFRLLRPEPGRPQLTYEDIWQN